MSKIRFSIKSLRAMLQEVVKLTEAGTKKFAKDHVFLPQKKYISLDVFKQTNPIAFKALHDTGNTRGQVKHDGPYIEFQPNDPGQKKLYWAGLPEKRDKSGDVVKKMSPHAWRTFDELTSQQKEKIGWVDPRERGQVKVNEEPPQEELMGLRLKGGDRGVSYAYDDDGYLVPGEVNVTGAVHAVNKSGDFSNAAKNALSNATKAKQLKIPDWETLSLTSLRKWEDVLVKKFKLHREPHIHRMLDIVQNFIADRVAGVPPKVVMSQKQQQRQKTEKAPEKSAQEKWGKRKSWGKTSPQVDVTSIMRQKK